MFYNSSDSGEDDDDDLSLNSDALNSSDEECNLLPNDEHSNPASSDEECNLLAEKKSKDLGNAKAKTENARCSKAALPVPAESTVTGTVNEAANLQSNSIAVGHNKINHLRNLAYDPNALQQCEAKPMLQVKKIDKNLQEQQQEEEPTKIINNQQTRNKAKELENQMTAREMKNEQKNVPPNSATTTKTVRNVSKQSDSVHHDSFESFHSAQELLEQTQPPIKEKLMLNLQEQKENSKDDEDEQDKCDDDDEHTIGSDGSDSVPRERSLSESLHAELGQLNELMECIEQERLSDGSDTETRKRVLESALSFERSCTAHDSEKFMAENMEDCLRIQRGYWSSIFGEASQCENKIEFTLEERYADIQQAHRALELLEDYHARLSEPQDRALRMAIERVIRIFKSRLFQALLAREFFDAYKCQAQCVQAVVKMLQQVKDENWCLPIMYTACSDLRMLAQKCEALGKSSKAGEILEKAADCLMSCFRVCAADNRSSDDDTKRIGMLNLVNQLFKVYFRINKLHLCKPLIRAIDSSTFKDSFPLAEQITYKFFVGRKAMYDADYKTADEFLAFALRNCPRNFPRNKRLILIYLVPVKMLLGYMPNKKILERFDVLQFYELSQALKEGNVRKFDEVIQTHKVFFIKFGIYLLVEKLKFIVYRNLFKKVYLIKQTHQLDLAAFQAALQFVGEEDMTMDETHCIVANLIFEGKIKGYISHSHNKLVVSKQNPFPPVNTVS